VGSPVTRVAILGADGDLTARLLLPALAELLEADRCGPLEIRGVGLGQYTTEGFREHIAPWLAERASGVGEASRTRLLDALYYTQGDVTDAAVLRGALEPGRGPLVAYLALPPAVFAPAVQALVASGVTGKSRVVVEKPHGQDLDSTVALNELLHAHFPEAHIFRMDHFLGKQTVQNVLGLRFANRLFEPLWNAQHIARVEVRWDETLTLEGRANYYDRAGALIDMLQNHLLQLACLVGMEPPRTLHERDLRDKKLEFLRAVRSLTPEEVRAQTVRARYTAGRVGEREVPSYEDEEGVKPERHTETFAQVALWVDNWRWAGVPFVLRSGKALGENRHEIAIHFREVPFLAFGQPNHPTCNVLRLSFNPDRLDLSLNLNGAGDPFELEEAELSLTLAPQQPSAYARLLQDILEGDPALSIRADEAEEAWRIVTPILEAWREGVVPMRSYPAGGTFEP
jgi:glucose-6-phosphate 1-dehydrogenase